MPTLTSLSSVSLASSLDRRVEPDGFRRTRDCLNLRLAATPLALLPSAELAAEHERRWAPLPWQSVNGWHPGCKGFWRSDTL
ncbi:hypothetical protein GCM10025762_13510 [Haloechinothrix salitolerans]